MTTMPAESTSTPRRLALHALPLLASIVVAGATLLYADDLPERVASHWSGGAADGWMSVVMLTALNGGLIVGLGYGLLTMALRMPAAKMVRPLAGVSVGLSAFLATLHVVTLQASVGAASEAPVPFPSGGLLNAISIAVVAGVLGWAIAEPGDDMVPRSLEVERLAVEPGEAVVWTGMARATTQFLMLPSFIALLGVGLLTFGEPLAGAILLVAASLAMTVIRVRVTIGPKGLRIRSGPMGLIGKTVPLADIAGVGAEHVDPMTHGGWGVRVTPGVRAVIVRSGEGIRLERHDKPDFVVTVDDAGRAAGVLRAHLDAAQTA